MEKTGKTRGHAAGLFGGVLLLTVANLLVKVFGFLYKVPLNRVLGDEMANVNAAYSVYTLLYMIATAGIPVAVSVLISEARSEGRGESVRRIFRVSLVALAAVGAFFTALVFLLARPIAGANSGGDSLLCLLAITPALFFICLSSVYRGYFQGLGQLRPTAVSQLIEAFGKMALGLLLVRLVLSYTDGGVHLAAGFSVFGITVGIALGALYLMLAYAKNARGSSHETSQVAAKDCESTRAILRRLVAVAVPIALSSGVLSLSSMIDSQLMRPLLSSYYMSEEMAKAVFSDYSTGAVTLFNLPAVLIYPITAALVPYITSERARGREEGARGAVLSALRVTAMISLPASLGMSALSRPILAVLFVGDADMAENAGPLLTVLALSVFPLAMLAITNAVLQAYRRQSKPIISMAIGVAVKILSLVLLTPVIGPVAAPLGTLLFYLAAVLTNLYFIFRYTGVGVALWQTLPIPLFASAASTLTALLVYRLVPIPSAVLPLFLAILAAVFVYLVIVLLLGGIGSEELCLLPHGDRLCRILGKYHLVRQKENDYESEKRKR